MEDHRSAETKLSLDERIAFINNYSLFCLLSPQDKRALALLIQEKQINPETVIVHEGDIVDAAFIDTVAAVVIVARDVAVKVVVPERVVVTELTVKLLV